MRGLKSELEELSAEASRAQKLFVQQRERLRPEGRLGELQRRAAELQQGVQLSERVPWR